MTVLSSKNPSNIIFAVDEEVRMLNCKKQSKKGCTNKTTKCITHNLWDQLDQHINGFFEKIKLQDLVKQSLNLNVMIYCYLVEKAQECLRTYINQLKIKVLQVGYQ